jgi:WD40 repeat protein
MENIMRQHRIVVFIAVAMLFCQIAIPASAQDECIPGLEIAWHPTDDLFAFNCNIIVYIYTSEFELITTLAAPPEPPETFPRATSLAWSPDGRYLAAGILRADAPGGDGSERRLVVWEIETGSVILNVPDRGSPIAWSPDSTMIATDSLFYSDGVYFYEIATGMEVAHCLRCSDAYHIEWNPADAHQTLISFSAITLIIDPLSPKILPQVYKDFSVISDGYRSDGTRFIAVNVEARQLEVRDAYTRDVLATLSFDTIGGIHSYHWLADGIYIETINHQVLRWDGVSKHAEILFSTEWRDHYWKPDGSLFVSPNYQNATFVGAFVYETLTGDLKAQLLYEATATPTPQP